MGLVKTEHQKADGLIPQKSQVVGWVPQSRLRLGPNFHQWLNCFFSIFFRVPGEESLPKGSIYSGWWFGTFFIFPYIGNNHPNWRTHIIQRGIGSTTNQIYIYIYIYIFFFLRSTKHQLNRETPHCWLMDWGIIIRCCWWSWWPSHCWKAEVKKLSERVRPEAGAGCASDFTCAVLINANFFCWSYMMI